MESDWSYEKITCMCGRRHSAFFNYVTATVYPALFVFCVTCGAPLDWSKREPF